MHTVGKIERYIDRDKKQIVKRTESRQGVMEKERQENKIGKRVQKEKKMEKRKGKEERKRRKIMKERESFGQKKKEREDGKENSFREIRFTYSGKNNIFPDTYIHILTKLKFKTQLKIFIVIITIINVIILILFISPNYM